jgi:hypothetical protein
MRTARFFGRRIARSAPACPGPLQSGLQLVPGGQAERVTDLGRGSGPRRAGPHTSSPRRPGRGPRRPRGRRRGGCGASASMRWVGPGRRPVAGAVWKSMRPHELATYSSPMRRCRSRRSGWPAAASSSACRVVLMLAVASVKDEVEHGGHSAGAQQPLGHGRLRHQEHPRDLGGAEARHGLELPGAVLAHLIGDGALLELRAFGLAATQDVERAVPRRGGRQTAGPPGLSRSHPRHSTRPGSQSPVSRIGLATMPVRSVATTEVIASVVAWSASGVIVLRPERAELELAAVGLRVPRGDPLLRFGEGAYRPSSVRPGWSAGRGPLRSQWNLRSDSRIGRSLMLACRCCIRPFSLNSQFSLP